jgi:hypothetical protein
MKIIFTFFLTTVFLLTHVQTFADCNNCSKSIVGSGNNLSINSGETVCITSGVQTGDVNFNGGSLCVGKNATFTPRNMNGFRTGSSLTIYGIVAFAGSITLDGGELNNYNVLNFGGTPNFNGAATITNHNGGSILFAQATTLSKGSIYNYGFIDAKADFSTNQTTAFFNTNRMHVGGNFNPAGTFNNYGLVVAQGFININQGDAFINNCRLVAMKGFNNNNTNAQNLGLMWVPGGVNSSNLIQVNENLINKGYIRTPRIINNKKLTNTDGQIRIEGSTTQNDHASNNNGSGNIVGGIVGDISNSSNTKAYSFDVNSGTITASYQFVEAYDTLSSNFASSCSPLYYHQPTYSISGVVYNDPNGLTDSTVNTHEKATPLVNVPHYAYLLVEKTGVITGVQQLNTANSFNFTNVAVGAYTLIISTTLAKVGEAAPAVTLPNKWVNVGEYLGAGEGSDGTIDGKLHVSVVNANVTNAKFGIQEVPSAERRTALMSRVRLRDQYTLNDPMVSILPLEGQDSNDGTLGEQGSFVITSLPRNAKLFYNGEEITSPSSVDTNHNLVPVRTFRSSTVPSVIHNYNPDLLKVAFTEEFDGNTSFDYSVMDSAQKYSEPATYFISSLQILPLEVSNLKGALNASVTSANLSWEILGAGSALNCTVQRSFDGEQFTSVANVESVTNGAVTYNDNLVNVAGVQSSKFIYYRLKITSASGTISYSNIIRLHTSSTETILISPNPTKNQIIVSGIEGKKTVWLLNTQGKTLQQQVSSNNSVSMNLANYPTGVYYVKVVDQNNNLISVKKVVKE